MAKKNKFTNMSTGMKLSVVALGVVTAIGGFVLFNGNSSIINSGGGMVKIDTSVAPQSIDKGSINDSNIINSEVISSVYENARKEKEANAKNNMDTYISQLALDNEVSMNNEIDSKIKVATEQSSIDAILDIDNQIALASKKEALRQQQQRLKENTNNSLGEAQIANNGSDRPSYNGSDSSQNYSGGGQSTNNGGGQVNGSNNSNNKTNRIYFDRDAFLKNELAGKSKGNESGIADEVDRIETIANTQINAGADYSSSKGGTSNGNSSTTSGNRASISERLKDKDLFDERKNSVANAKYKAADRVREANGANAIGTNKKGNLTSSYMKMSDPAGITEQVATTYVNAGTIFYSTLDIGINTDEISYVKATIIQEGVFKGGTLMGMPERKGEKAVVVFNNIALNGKDIPIQAVALDLDTMRAGIADKVDNHTFERYAKLMTAAFISGYAESLTNSTTSTNSDGSSTTIVSSLPDTKDQVAYAIGTAGKTLVPIFEQEFSRETTVEVYANKEIGIMLLQGVEVEE